MELYVPGLAVARITSVHESDYLRELRGAPRRAAGVSDATRWLQSLGMASKSDYLEGKDLNHNLGKEAFTMPAALAVALCTAVPTDASTGSTITEATYTGYLRKAIIGSELTQSGTSPTKNANNAVITFAACTGSTSTIIGFALCDSATTAAGNVLYWGTVTSTVISITQTPATIASGALEVTED